MVLANIWTLVSHLIKYYYWAKADIISSEKLINLRHKDLSCYVISTHFLDQC